MDSMRNLLAKKRAREADGNLASFCQHMISRLNDSNEATMIYKQIRKWILDNDAKLSKNEVTGLLGSYGIAG